MENKIQNIIFDMGGVLIQWRPQVIAEGFSPEPQVRQILVETVFGQQIWQEWDRGAITLPQVKQRIVAQTGFSVAETDRLMDEVLESLDLIEPSVALLHELHERGYGIYCLSNMPVEHYQELQQRLPVWQYFKDEVISGVVGVSKPDPAIFSHMLDKFGLTPESCLFLDDYPQNIEAARALGIHAYQYRDAADFRKHMPQLFS